MHGAGKAEIGLALGLPVAVDQNFLCATLARFAHEAGVLAAGHIGNTVGERPVWRGDSAVVFLDAALHLGKERFLQLRRIRHGGFEMGILGLEERADLGVQRFRLAHHLLPVLRPQPVVGIDTAAAVNRVADRTLRRKRNAAFVGGGGGSLSGGGSGGGSVFQHGREVGLRAGIGKGVLRGISGIVREDAGCGDL